MLNTRYLLPFIIYSLLITIASCTNEKNLLLEKTTNKKFIVVIEDAEFAITENNFRITNRLHIGKAIQERGNRNFPKNEVILFCNLTLAEKMLQIEPRYIHYCPYKISITEANGQIIIGTQLLPTNTGKYKLDQFATEINKTLSSMVEYAISDDPFILEQHDHEVIQ